MSYLLQVITAGRSDERSLKDWGINEDSALLNLNSFQADVFSFTMAAADAFAEDGKFVYGSLLRLKQNGTVVFQGTVRELPVFGSTSAERQRIVAYNYWHDFESWIYRRNRKIMADDFSGLDLVATSQIILARDPSSGHKITNLEEITNLCAFAALPLSAAFTGVTPPFEQVTDIPVATALRRMVAWQPNLLGQTYYGGGGVPELIIQDPAHASVIDFDLTAGAPMLSIEGRVRRDLVPAGVLVYFIVSVVDPATGIRYAKVVQDSGGAPTTGPYTMIVTMSVGDGENAPLGLAAAYYTALSTPFLEGSLVVQSREADLSWRPGSKLSFAHAPASWAGSYAPIIAVSHQLAAGISTISFGPPQFLPFSSFAQLNQKVKDSRPPDQKPPEGPGDGSPGTSPGDKGGTHDTGFVGIGGGGGSPNSAGITNCVDGTQVNTRVLTP